MGKCNVDRIHKQSEPSKVTSPLSSISISAFFVYLLYTIMGRDKKQKLKLYYRNSGQYFIRAYLQIQQCILQWPIDVFLLGILVYVSPSLFTSYAGHDSNMHVLVSNPE